MILANGKKTTRKTMNKIGDIGSHSKISNLNY